MNNPTLYLKYRPQTLDELDSEFVRESLKKIVFSGKIPHSILFAGPKGTGKTSAARILAKILNCESASQKIRGGGRAEPCGKCEQCVSISNDSNLDVIEMDAASHRGIDDVRILRDAVKLAPAKALNKIYIIDEVHMLTTEAENALLKILEEPPIHVYFILATTNPEKLIETIKSRTTNIIFKKATEGEIVRSLSRVIKGEKINVDDEVLYLIAKAASGSFRDAVKFLEQLLIGNKKLSKEIVQEFLYQRKAFNPQTLVESLINKETKKCLQEISEAISSGVTVGNIYLAILESLREELLAQVGIGEKKILNVNKNELVKLIKLLGRSSRDLSDSPIEELSIEVAIIEWCEGGKVRENEEVIEKTLPQKLSVAPTIPKIDFSEKKPSPSLKSIDDELWRKILVAVRPINTSIEALLRAARPIAFDGKTLTLGVFYKFHKERLEDFQHRRILEGVAGQILGAEVSVVCTLTEPPVRKIENKPEEKKEELVLTEGEDPDIIKVAKEIFEN